MLTTCSAITENQQPCTACSSPKTRVAYMRATELRAYTASYHAFGQKTILSCYQDEQKELFRRYMTHDRVCDWVQTTKRSVLGVTHQPSAHPFRNFLLDVYPSSIEGWQPRWKIFLSACDALKRYPHIPHASRLFLFEDVTLQETELSCTLFCPLPIWTDQVLARLATFPPHYQLDRATLLAVLCGHFAYPRTIAEREKQGAEERRKQEAEMVKKQAKKVHKKQEEVGEEPVIKVRKKPVIKARKRRAIQ